MAAPELGPSRGCPCPLASGAVPGFWDRGRRAGQGLCGSALDARPGQALTPENSCPGTGGLHQLPGRRRSACHVTAPGRAGAGAGAGGRVPCWPPAGPAPSVRWPPRGLWGRRQPAAPASEGADKQLKKSQSLFRGPGDHGEQRGPSEDWKSRSCVSSVSEMPTPGATPLGSLRPRRQNLGTHKSPVCTDGPDPSAGPSPWASSEALTRGGHKPGRPGVKPGRGQENVTCQGCWDPDTAAPPRSGRQGLRTARPCPRALPPPLTGPRPGAGPPAGQTP